ncbi:MAG: phosphatase PAP2 family protein, partial [Candidatus Binatia bacterium]
MNNSQVESLIFLLAFIAAILLVWQLSWLIVRLVSRMLRALALRNAVSYVWASTHPLRALAAERFPGIYRFLDRRLNPQRFSGLPLTLMIAAAIYAIALLGGIIEEVLEAEEIRYLDVAISRFFDPFRTPMLVEIFAWITELGASYTLVGIALISTGLFWAHERVYLILPLWITILGTQATTWLGKFGFDRTRPEFVTEVTAFSPAFPSAHASSAMAVFGFMAYAIARDLPHLRQDFEITYWSLIVIGLI